MLRKLVKPFYARLPKRWQSYLLFIWRTGYRPNFKNPKTFNEKIGYRKRNWCNEHFATCSDKIAVRDYVASRVGKQYLIESFYSGEGGCSPALLTSIVEQHGDILVKANHNSGPVQFIYADSKSESISEVSREINRQIAQDYGGPSIEGWYSAIRPGVLVEKNISTAGQDLADYKYHVFNQADGARPYIVVHVDVDRSVDHHRVFFDEKFNRLPFSCKFPIGLHTINRPPNYEVMLEIATKLAEPFSYARVDLYNVNGRILFGEITFAHESGHGGFRPNHYDRWLGDLWTMNPAR